jgi:hypothetical protein
LLSLSLSRVSLQRRQARANQKSTSHHYSSLEDSVPGFRIEPPAVAVRGPATLQSGGGFGSTWYNRSDQRAVSRASSSVRASASHLTSQRSYAQSRGTDLHPSSSAATNANSRYNRLDVAEPANAVGRPGSSHHKDLGMRDVSVVSANQSHSILTILITVDATAQAVLIAFANILFPQGFGGRNKRIHYSGPLMPPGGNMEDMLKEHEKQIQQAVRKARVEKEKTNRHYY